jgi:hypothetical protein
MAISVNMGASQGAAGAPIQISAQTSINEAAGDDMPYVGIGVTIANVFPGTLAGFAHYEGVSTGFLGDPAWDTAAELFRQSAGGGVTTQYVDQNQVGKLQRIDANYVVGRYLWVFTCGAGVISGSTVPNAHSASYLIR